MKREDKVANHGIQANSVTGDVIAVGSRSSASKTVYQTGDSQALVEQNIAALRIAFEGLGIDKVAHSVLEEDLGILEQAINNRVPTDIAEGVIEQLIKKLKMVGVVVNETENILEPIRRIGSALGLTMKFLL